ncbi:MAG: NusG domain II-containing protein [Treponema sp.]|jgi:hypothetical protein|nr:NusG domain II-containing protein [Treponema sp.]
MRIRFFDISIILFAALVTVYSAYFAYLKPQGRLQVLIRGQGREWVFPLDAEEKITVTGQLGDTVARIGGGRAWVESSPCENQTCVAAGVISRHGQWAACLPNGVLVILQGSGGEDVDAISW